jgi:hypothetical protein
MCIYIFIGVSAYTYMSICICTVGHPVKKKREWSISVLSTLKMSNSFIVKILTSHTVIPSLCWIDLWFDQKGKVLMTNCHLVGSWLGVTFLVQWPGPNLHMPINKVLTTNYVINEITNVLVRSRHPTDHGRHRGGWRPSPAAGDLIGAHLTSARTLRGLIEEEMDHISWACFPKFPKQSWVIAKLIGKILKQLMY